MYEDSSSTFLDGAHMAEEIDSKIDQNITQKKSVGRIRSGVRRRILDKLSESRSTVTEIAKEVGLRMPHASAELKRLREENLVNSDEETGSRGARLALTAKGWDTLRGDEITRLESLTQSQPPENALGRLVSVIGNNILVAFIRRPLDGPLALPSHPLESDLIRITEETHSSDWIWAEPRERRPRWLDAETFLPVSPPVEDLDPSRIGAWGAKVPVWGLQRYRIIDANPLRLGIGSWFGEPGPDSRPLPPGDIPLRGDWRLGSISQTGPEIRPSSPVLGIGLDRLSKESLLSAAAAGAVTIAPLSLLPAPSGPFPLELLEHWVELAHPRLRPIDRVQRLTSLRDALISPNDIQLRRKVDDSTWRRFRQHWGDQNWNNDSVIPGQMIDTTSLSALAESTIIKWAVDSKSNLNFNLATSQMTNVEKLLQRMPSNFRLLLVSDWVSSSTSIRLTPHSVLPSMWAQMTFSDGEKFPVNLGPAPPSTTISDDVIWDIPKTADEVQKSKEILAGYGDFTIPELSSEQPFERLIRAAVLSYPTGNEDWANRMEVHHPLVAWIASSPENRWNRWQRIGMQLGVEWIDLMNPTDIPLSAIATAAVESPQDWSDNISQSIRGRIRIDSNVAHQIRHSGENASTAEASWIASVLFAEVAWLTSSQQEDLSKWGIDRFFDNPPKRCQAAITGVDWLAQLNPENLQSQPDDWRARARSIAFALPHNHDLHLWAQLDDWLNLDARPNITIMRLIVECLPEEWWAPVAETLLTVLSDEIEAQTFLEIADVAWPALILRPIDESHRLPGGTISQHGGVRRTLLSRLDRLTERSNWLEDENVGSGAKMIIDLRDALQAGRTLSKPSRGHTHSRVGWLAVPSHLWPPDDLNSIAEGDPRISSRLVKKASGWHVELSRNPLDV